MRKLHAPENQRNLVQRPSGQIDRTVPERTSLQKCSPGPRNHAKKAEEVTEILGDYKCKSKRQRNTPAADMRSRDWQKSATLLGKETVGPIRKTDEDPPRISVIDVFAATVCKSQDHASKQFRRITERYDEVRTNCPDFRFRGSPGSRLKRWYHRPAFTDSRDTTLNNKSRTEYV